MCVKPLHNVTALSLLIQKEERRLCSDKYESGKDIYINVLLPSFFMFSFSHEKQSQNNVPLGGHCFNPWLWNTCPDSSANGQSFTEHCMISYSSLFKLWIITVALNLEVPGILNALLWIFQGWGDIYILESILSLYCCRASIVAKHYDCPVQRVVQREVH